MKHQPGQCHRTFTFLHACFRLVHTEEVAKLVTRSGPARSLTGTCCLLPCGESGHFPLTETCSSGHHHRMPAPLFANKPECCPYGHSLAPVCRRKSPGCRCICDPALGSSRARPGHGSCDSPANKALPGSARRGHHAERMAITQSQLSPNAKSSPGSAN
jgi:hypothetical protein